MTRCIVLVAVACVLFPCPVGAQVRASADFESLSDNGVAVSPKTGVVAVANMRGTVFLWDIAGKKKLKPLKKHSWAVNGVDFSADGSRFATGAGDATVYIWGTKSWEVVKSLPAQPGPVIALAYSPDGKTLAVASYTGKYPTSQGVIRCWDAATGREKAGWNVQKPYATTVRYAPDGRTILTGGLDGTVRVWDVGTMKEKSQIQAHADRVVALAVSPDGKTVATRGADRRDSVKVWDIAKGEMKLMLTTKVEAPSLAFSPDGKMLAAGDYDTVQVWEMPKGRLRATLKGAGGTILSVAFTRDGKAIVGGDAATLYEWAVPEN